MVIRLMAALMMVVCAAPFFVAFICLAMLKRMEREDREKEEGEEGAREEAAGVR
jgi:preprotein translocase subunit SecG